MQNGYIGSTALGPAHILRRAPGQQHPPKETAAGKLDGGHAGQKLKALKARFCRHVFCFLLPKCFGCRLAGQGVAVVDGKIVENLHIVTAKAVLAKAEAIAALAE